MTDEQQLRRLAEIGRTAYAKLDPLARAPWENLTLYMQEHWVKRVRQVLAGTVVTWVVQGKGNVPARKAFADAVRAAGRAKQTALFEDT